MRYATAKATILRQLAGEPVAEPLAWTRLPRLIAAMAAHDRTTFERVNRIAYSYGSRIPGAPSDRDVRCRALVRWSCDPCPCCGGRPSGGPKTSEKSSA